MNTQPIYEDGKLIGHQWVDDVNLDAAKVGDFVWVHLGQRMHGDIFDVKSPRLARIVKRTPTQIHIDGLKHERFNIYWSVKKPHRYIGESVQALSSWSSHRRRISRLATTEEVAAGERVAA